MDIDSRGEAFFIADHPALDLLNSIAAPSAIKIEWISDGNDLLNWLEQANLITPDEIEKFRLPGCRAAVDAIAVEACKLREWFREFIIEHAGQPLDASALNAVGPINKLLRKDNSHHQIEAVYLSHATNPEANISLQLKRQRHWQSADVLLQVIAEVMAELICNIDFKLIKNCEGSGCTLWFYDVSKNHSRRWCSMSICGNRAKAALHRAKKKSLKKTSSTQK